MMKKTPRRYIYQVFYNELRDVPPYHIWQIGEQR